MTNAGLSQIGALTELRLLTLGKTKITGGGIARLQGLTKLEELDLSETAVSDADLRCLGGLHNLRNLYLDKTKITDAGLSSLSRLRNLQTLDLHDTETTEAGVTRLAEACLTRTFTTREPTARPRPITAGAGHRALYVMLAAFFGRQELVDTQTRHDLGEFRTPERSMPAGSRWASW